MLQRAAIPHDSPRPVGRHLGQRSSWLLALLLSVAAVACSGGKPSVTGPADDDASTDDIAADARPSGTSATGAANEEPPTPAEEDIEVPAAP